MGNFKEDIAKVRAIVLDVDGVMTAGKITMLPDGDFLREYNAKDGFAMMYAMQKGYTFAIITGGRGHCLNLRFEMMGIKHCYTNCLAKMGALEDFMALSGFKPEEMAYMGDDIPDIEPMKHVGVSMCPADASVDVLRIARHVSQFKGGQGCVRDLIEQVLRSRGDWVKDGERVDFATK